MDTIRKHEETSKDERSHRATQTEPANADGRRYEVSKKSADEREPVPLSLTIDDLRGRATCSVDQAAAVLQIGRSTAYAAAHDGSLPVLRISNRLLVSVPRLLALIDGDAHVSSNDV